MVLCMALRSIEKREAIEEQLSYRREALDVRMQAASYSILSILMAIIKYFKHRPGCGYPKRVVVKA